MPSRNRFTELISSCRINSACGYSVEETCPYCSAPVHFESADVAICRERHTLTRCRASTILCSVLQPVWHCVCCGGMVDKLLPQSFFTTRTKGALCAPYQEFIDHLSRKNQGKMKIWKVNEKTNPLQNLQQQNFYSTKFVPHVCTQVELQYITISGTKDKQTNKRKGEHMVYR